MSSSQATVQKPLVTIAMPVYNEERFLELALESLLQQNYENVQILISDNASTDKTGEIALRFATANDRVVYLRTEKNIGVAANFQRTLEMAEGKYFMWAAGHDEWSENLVSESVAILEANNGAAIAFANSYWIDESGQRSKRKAFYNDTRGMNTIKRFFNVLWGNMHPVLGLIRLDYLRHTKGVQNFAGADLVLLSELVLLGDFVHVPQAWWNRREIRQKESFDERMQRYATNEYGLSNSWLDRLFPLLRLPLALIAVVWNANIFWLLRFGLLVLLLPSLPVRYIAGRHEKNQ